MGRTECLCYQCVDIRGHYDAYEAAHWFRRCKINQIRAHVFEYIVTVRGVTVCVCWGAGEWVSGAFTPGDRVQGAAKLIFKIKKKLLSIHFKPLNQMKGNLTVVILFKVHNFF
jgi:hypothetical protein